MHIALIIDQERLAHEQSMLDRISVGLIDRGAQLTTIVPDTQPVDDAQQSAQLVAAGRIEVSMNVPPWMRRTRAHRLAKALESAVPDVLHAVGDRAWMVGLDLARVVDRPVTIDVWSADQVQRVPHRRSASQVAGYVASTEPIAEGLRKRIAPELVSLVPIGVTLPPHPREVLANPQDMIALAIIGSGRDIAAYRAMLGGLSRLTQEFPQIQGCLELRGPHEHEIWQCAQRLNLRGHLSAITDAALHRRLLTGCDVLLIPERLGHVRSLMFEAMAFGMPIVASDDPFLDALVPDETAIIVGNADPQEWAQQLRRLLIQPELARSVGASAQALIAARHQSTDQVGKLMAAFEQVLSGGAHSFAGTGT
ncbi:MAG: glycosyltransferase [Phycisphaerales bacterium]